MHWIKFFTVYGPWGRPDMALFLFKINNKSRTYKSFQQRSMVRDFTYIDDITESPIRLINKPKT